MIDHILITITDLAKATNKKIKKIIERKNSSETFDKTSYDFEYYPIPVAQKRHTISYYHFYNITYEENIDNENIYFRANSERVLNILTGPDIKLY